MTGVELLFAVAGVALALCAVAWSLAIAFGADGFRRAAENGAQLFAGVLALLFVVWWLA